MNPKEKTLLLLGCARTSTQSLWRFLGDHPQISPSKIKEPLREMLVSNYINNWNLNRDVLLDATPTWWVYNTKMISDFRRVCCLFIIRNYFQWVRSKLRLNLRMIIDQRPYYFLRSDGSIIKNIVDEWIQEGMFRSLKEIEKYIDKNNKIQNM